MYCSSCGSARPPRPSYFKRCGGDLHPQEKQAPQKARPSPHILGGGSVIEATLGLFAVIMLMGMMSQVLHSPDGLINGFAAVAFFSVLLVDALFTWLLLRSKNSPGKTADVVQLREAIRAELQAAQTSGLAQPV